jgi:hypothetical protein
VRRWSFALGGLIAWTAHFAGVYAFASLAAQTPADDTAVWQAAALALSIACAGSCGLLLAAAGRRLRRPRRDAAGLMDQLAVMGAGLGLVAILWQTASIVIV